MRPQAASHRIRSYGTTSAKRRAIVGNTAGWVPPAWKSSYAMQNRRQVNGSDDVAARRAAPPVGSKIFMSQLPTDSVDANDIEGLFKESIGPVFDVFMIYNSQGKSKGMAVVHFQRPGDAIEARRRYNGKIIDGRRPLKIELIVDPPEAPKEQVVKPKSLADRLSGPPNACKTPAVPPPRRNKKKGPRRFKNFAHQLDKDMETYMARRNASRPESNIMARIEIRP